MTEDTPRRSVRNSKRHNYRSVNEVGFEIFEFDHGDNYRMSHTNQQDDQIEETEPVVINQEQRKGLSEEVKDNLETPELYTGNSDGLEEMGDEELEIELEKARKEGEWLKKQKIREEKISLIRNMRSTNVSQKAEAGRQKVRSQQPSKSTGKSYSDKQFNIQSLRQDKVLSSQVLDTLQALGINQASQDAEEEEEEDFEGHLHQRFKSRGKQSGIFAENNDNVVNQVLWPQERLGPQYISLHSGKIQYKNLDFTLFCAGEMEILTSNEISENEKNARSQLFKDIIYNSLHYEWQAVLRLHAAILTEVENGMRCWGDETARLEQKILMPFAKKTVSSVKTGKGDKPTFFKRPDEEKVWFCSAYNRNNCSYREPHLTKFNDKTYVVQHICATCYQKDKRKQFHREKSADCPHTEK